MDRHGDPIVNRALVLDSFIQFQALLRSFFLVLVDSIRFVVGGKPAEVIHATDATSGRVFLDNRRGFLSVILLWEPHDMQFQRIRLASSGELRMAKRSLLLASWSCSTNGELH
jgi:hypothetical protein